MKSIIQHEKECYFCGRTDNLDIHHCIHGTANRKNADKYGLKIYVCKDHHTMGPDAIHRNAQIDNQVKQMAQKKFEETHTREQFIGIFGKSYL